MNEKTKELIAIGASVTANCIPCFRYHYQKACETGATDDEIRDAVKVGRMVRKGAAQKWDEEINSLLGKEPPSAPAGDETVCGGPQAG